ncbi:MAG TPA: Uma2 family endonuclease [Nocardioidaceae bacterium]|nr:Uma2 family endonuclease [Nocardioidaceae bacterium]
MSTMTAQAGLPFGRPLTVEDLEAMPDDGHRYELIDGTLIVTPAPSWPHQGVQVRLTTWLYERCPRDLRVIAAPFEVQLAMDTAVQPDLIVTRFADLTRKNLPVPPLLAVEIGSPSTALIDRNLKRATYERFGIPSYWLVDPDPERPTLTVLELESEAYVERATVTVEESVEVATPFEVRLSPWDLTRDLRPE